MNLSDEIKKWIESIERRLKFLEENRKKVRRVLEKANICPECGEKLSTCSWKMAGVLGVKKDCVCGYYSWRREEEVKKE